MKTFPFFFSLTALVAAAPFDPTGVSGIPAPSGTAPPYHYPGTGFPSSTGAFALNGISGYHHHYPSGYAYHTGTAPVTAPTPCVSRPSFDLPSLSRPAGSGVPLPSGHVKGPGSGFSLPAGGLRSESSSVLAFPTKGLGTKSGSPNPEFSIPTSDMSSGLGNGIILPTKGFASEVTSTSAGGFDLPTGFGSGSGSYPSFTLPTMSGAGSATPTGLSGFESARRKAQFDGTPSFSYLPLSTAAHRDGNAAPTGTAARPCPSGIPTGTAAGLLLCRTLSSIPHLRR